MDIDIVTRWEGRKGVGEWGLGEDGHIGGQMRLENSVSPGGKIHWRVFSLLALKKG
jgi:hypothetical protein